MLMGHTLVMVIVIIVVTIVAIIAQRKWGSKGPFWVWIASAVIITGATLFWVFYQAGFPLPSTRQDLFAMAIISAFLFMAITFVSGMLTWAIASFGPRPPQDRSSEINYFPFYMPVDELEGTSGLAGILWRYQELLATFATALDTALASTPANPYQSVLRGFYGFIRTFSPSYQQQAKASERQFKRVPNALRRGLAGAAAVLAELETLTPAELSAIEECHRVNVRRLRRRSVFSWSWKTIGVVFTTLSGIAVTAMNVWGVKTDDLWPLIKGVNLTGADLQSAIIKTAILFLVGATVGLLTNLLGFFPILNRVQAFEDILTIAKAYRKLPGEATKSPAEPSLTDAD
jgi:hypothetical protein